jgi:poly(A) polymerase
LPASDDSLEPSAGDGPRAPATDDPRELIRAVLQGRRAWVVGGAVRDRLLGRETEDFDVVLDGDPSGAARAIAKAAGKATAFALSEEYGGWRVTARDGAWQIDVERLRGATLEDDLKLRDFTVNAIAEPVGEPAAGSSAAAAAAAVPGVGPAAGEGGTIDPLGGVRDLADRRLRAAGPDAFVEDPLRVLRLVRIAVELGFEPDRPTLEQAREEAEGLRAVAGERVFMELRRIIDAPRAVDGLRLTGEVGAMPVVLPELEALKGVEQSRYHHLDVYGHTLEVLARTIALQADPGEVFGEEHAQALAALLAEPLADGLTRGGALRWGALLHDSAKPLTRGVAPDLKRARMRVTFIGHDVVGADLAEEVLGRLRASGRLKAHTAALVRNHLRLGFLVHEPQPLSRRTVFAYLRACEPVEVDVTLLSAADRLATKGDRAEEAIAAHMKIANAMAADALRMRAGGEETRPLLRGDELARELGIAEGPRIGELLEELAAARYAGEVATKAEALEHARKRLG